MAESSLSVGYPDLRQEVGRFLGYGQLVADWSSDTTKVAHVESAVQSGVRQVYYPPAVHESTIGYEWSWLRPTETLDIYNSYSTGTVTIASGVVTLASGTFPSWAADGELTVDGASYPVDTRDGDTQVTLVDTTVTVAAGTSYSLAQADYDLPDNFGRMVGEFHFEPGEYRISIHRISIGALLAKRARTDLSGTPECVAIRYKSSDGSDGQRQEALFYPNPDGDKTLYYNYEAYSGELSDSYPYPLGGMQLAELYIESCLAIAEQRFNDETGLHSQRFTALLLDAVARDQKRGTRNFGQMGHVETVSVAFRRGWTGSTYPITYNGETL